MGILIAVLLVSPTLPSSIPLLVSLFTPETRALSIKVIENSAEVAADHVNGSAHTTVLRYQKNFAML